MAKATKPERKLSELEIWLNDHLVRVPVMQKILFVHNLSIMVKAGLSIVDGLRILAEQVDNQKLKKVIAEIKGLVEKGQQLSEALSNYPQVFPPIYVSMIAAGETAGKMEEALTQVSDQMKKSHELTAHIKGALIYPAVVLTAMAGIAIEMVVFVLPKILGMFAELHAQLPLSTRVLIFIVDAVQHYGILIAIGIIALIALWIWLIKKPKIRSVVHGFMLIIPIIGPVIKKINIARFTLTLSSLLQSAIPIIDAVRITAGVEGNVKYRDSLLAASESLKKGEALSDALGRTPELFPPMVVQMIMVGEQSGEVEGMLKELANYYSNEVDMTMKNFSTIIEPILILTLGIGVAGIAVSVIMPIYSLTESF